MKPVPATASFSEFAAIAGYKRSYVTQLQRDGRLVLDADKRIRVPETLQLIKDTSDPAKAGVARRHAAARAAQAATATEVMPQPPTTSVAGDAHDDDPDGRPGSPYQLHRTEKERYAALSAKRDYEVSMRELLPAAEVEGAIAGIVTRLRKAMERIPDELAPQIAPLSDELAIRALLAEHVEAALAETSRQFQVLAKEHA